MTAPAIALVDATIPCPNHEACGELTCCATDSCDEWACGDHTPSPWPCEDGGLHHSEECALSCAACVNAARPCRRAEGFR